MSRYPLFTLFIPAWACVRRFFIKYTGRLFLVNQKNLGNSANTTVIVGAGVIGLSTAYQLAHEQQKSGRVNSIIVIDINDAVCAQASACNSGCIIPAEMDKKIRPLADYSYGMYLALAEKGEDFRSKTGFREQSLFSVNQGNGHGHDLLPSWFKTDPQWDAHSEPRSGHSALINPIAFGEWLKSHCEALGIKIETSADLRSVQSSEHGTIKSIRYHSKLRGDVEIMVKNLVLATGPWTEELFTRLFPGTQVSLEFSPIAGDYVIFRNPCNITENSLSAVFLDSIVGHKLEFSARNDDTIWVCAQVNKSARLTDPRMSLGPDPEMIDELLNYTKRFVNLTEPQNEKHVDAIDVINMGRSFRPSRHSVLPVIAAVPRTKLHRDLLADGHADKVSGIFICSGHGSYGIALAMGSARLMAQLILGQHPDIDISDFGLHHTREHGTFF